MWDEWVRRGQSRSFAKIETFWGGPLLRAIRALLCTLGVVAGLLVVTGGTADAVGSTSLTPGVVGYGTVHVSAASPPADCAAPASNAGGTNANVDAGHEYDCAAFTASSYDTCTGSIADFGFSCEITLVAQTSGTGWRFDHWSGDCSGASATCTATTRIDECDPDVKPVCQPWQYFGPLTVVAHFVDTQAPTINMAVAPPNNGVVYSDSHVQTFSWTTNEDDEAPSFACKRDGGSFNGCSSGFTWSSIADGIHDFCVHATDASGLQGTDQCRHWQQESNPVATIVTHPPAMTGTPDASFGYTSNKASHPADGSTLTYLCRLDDAPFGACPTTLPSYDLLANGQHTFQVESVFTAALGGGAHASPVASYTWTQADTTGPTVTLTTAPESVTTSTSATVSWTGSEPGEEQSFMCKLDDDPAGFQPCTSPQTYSDLGDGTHSLYVQGEDFLGNIGPTTTAIWTVDTTAPTVAPNAAGPFTLAASVHLGWAGSDGTGSGITAYRVRVERASWDAGFGGWSDPSGWQSATTTSLPVDAGYTYCYEVQAKDAAGNVSGWSSPQCTARALDDRSLRSSPGWTRGTGRAYYLGTYTSTKRMGARLSVSGVQLDRLALVATRCKTCGTVGVYAGTKLIKQVSLRRASAQRKVVIALPPFAPRTTSVRIKVLSSGRNVQIDGLAVSRA
jgi:hypothetical protein